MAQRKEEDEVREDSFLSFLLLKQPQSKVGGDTEEDSPCDQYVNTFPSVFQLKAKHLKKIIHKISIDVCLLFNIRTI